MHILHYIHRKASYQSKLKSFEPNLFLKSYFSIYKCHNNYYCNCQHMQQYFSVSLQITLKQNIHQNFRYFVQRTDNKCEPDSHQNVFPELHNVYYLHFTYHKYQIGCHIIIPESQIQHPEEKYNYYCYLHFFILLSCDLKQPHSYHIKF